MVAGDDVVHEICRVQWGKRTLFDILALTDRRIVLLGKGVIRSKSEDYPLSRVSSISVRKKMLSTAVEFSSSGAKRSVSVLDARGADGLVLKARQLIAASGGTPAQVVAAPAAPDPMGQLAQLVLQP